MLKYFRQYREASLAIKSFIWTVVCLVAMLIISTVWAYVRLETARTNIPSPAKQSNLSQP